MPRSRPPPRARASRTVLLVGCALLGGVLALALHGLDRAPQSPAAAWTVGIYAACSPLSFLLYWWDKRAAQRGARRVPERQLHLVDLIGGWPGGLLAQQLLRHKTVKPAYQLWFWLTALANTAAFTLSMVRIPGLGAGL